MSIITYKECIEDIYSHIEALKKVKSQIETIQSIAHEYRFSLSAPQKFLDGLQKEARYHESKIELINNYIAKHHTK